jgi:predicted HicB family RNase H-like nuclease
MIVIMRRSQPRTKEPKVQRPLLMPQPVMEAARADAHKRGLSLNAWITRLAARETGLLEYDFPDPAKDP